MSHYDKTVEIHATRLRNEHANVLRWMSENLVSTKVRLHHEDTKTVIDAMDEIAAILHQSAPTITRMERHVLWAEFGSETDATAFKLRWG